MTGSRCLPCLAVGLTLVILGVAIGAGTSGLRQRLQRQIVERDGEVLHAVTLMQQQAEQELDAQFNLADPAAQFQVLLKSSFLEGVMGARLFTPKGAFVTAFPEYVPDRRLERGDLLAIRSLVPVSRYHPRANLDEFFLPSNPGAPLAAGEPLLEIIIPIHEKDGVALLGVAQYLVDGRNIAQDFAALDRTLFWRAGVLFVVCGGVIAAGLSWAFARLARLNRELEARTESLLQANQELALMARTSAVGAIAANLMHGLKSPLFGLLNLFAAWRASDRVGEKVEWNTAMETARRMQSMINGVMEVVRDQEGMANNETTLAELLGVLEGKIVPLAAGSGVRFERDCAVDTVISSRMANLLAMILLNLVQNAIEATPAGRQVRLSIREQAQGLAIEVVDEGQGIPPALEPQLFQPVESAKPGGSGVGLAICKQLARHLGAELKLVRNTAAGCVFGLTVPAALLPARGGRAA